MFGRRSLVAAVLLAALSGGCGTIDNVRRPVMPAPNSTNAQVCRVYGGVRAHWDAITDYPWRNTPCTLDYVVLPAMAIADLGLSGFGDTVTLPYTIGAEVWRLFAPPGSGMQPLPVTATSTAPAGEPAPAPQP